MVRVLATHLCSDEAISGIGNSGDGGARASNLLVSLLSLIVASLHDDGQVVHLLRRRVFLCQVYQL